jgi:alkylation response protein AidB-like acyl-CoA dehydrogenase
VVSKFYSHRNLEFLLYEVFDLVSLTKSEYFGDHNKKVFDMVLKEAGKLAKDLFLPVFEEMDRKQPELVKGEVIVHPSVRKILDAQSKGGWLTSTLPYEADGDQLPQLLNSATSLIFAAANYSASAYASLTSGAAGLLLAFGSKELRKHYVPRMLSAEWQGTMALTEPEAGSSLSDITTEAVPTDQDHYLIKGQKIFISAGDHNAAENVVHMMLARIQGAPAGVKGISLFMVPKKRINSSGDLEANDVVTSGVYHKLGYRGCPIVQLSIGDNENCYGWLVGEAQKGLKYMFQMMNEARIDVGIGATSISTAAYYSALNYCRTRLQGRKVDQKGSGQPQVPIIEHADIKRMLLFQKAVNEGSLSLILQCARYLDLQQVLPDGEEKEKYHLLLELLTPIAKSYPSEMGIQAISQGLQCLGGSGYCDDYPLEQYYRDARIHPIHEGTTGIQGMDLLGRKVVMNNGKALVIFLEEVHNIISKAKKVQSLSHLAEKLEKSLSRLNEINTHLFALAQEAGPEVFLADATLYLEFFGLIAIAWQWLIQGITAHQALERADSKSETSFYQGKLFALRYFFAYELPKTEGLATRLLDSDRLTIEMTADSFLD